MMQSPDVPGSQTTTKCWHTRLHHLARSASNSTTYIANSNLPLSPQPGWTMDPEELDYEGDWLAEDSWGHALIKEYNLGECTPIRCRDDNMGGGEAIFESSGKLFLFNMLGLDLYVLIRPATLEEMIAIMKGEKKGRLKWKRYSSDMK